MPPGRRRRRRRRREQGLVQGGGAPLGFRHDARGAIPQGDREPGGLPLSREPAVLVHIPTALPERGEVLREEPGDEVRHVELRHFQPW